MSQKQGVATCQDKTIDYGAKIFFGGYWAPGSTFKHRLVIIREKKCFLNLPSAHCAVCTVHCTVYNVIYTRNAKVKNTDYTKNASA